MSSTSRVFSKGFLIQPIAWKMMTQQLPSWNLPFPVERGIYSPSTTLIPRPLNCGWIMSFRILSCMLVNMLATDSWDKHLILSSSYTFSYLSADFKILNIDKYIISTFENIWGLYVIQVPICRALVIYIISEKLYKISGRVAVASIGCMPSRRWFTLKCTFK